MGEKPKFIPEDSNKKENPFFAPISSEEQAEIERAKLDPKIRAAEEADELARIRQEIDPEKMVDSLREVKKPDETRDDN